VQSALLHEYGTHGAQAQAQAQAQPWTKVWTGHFQPPVGFCTPVVSSKRPWCGYIVTSFPLSLTPFRLAVPGRYPPKPSGEAQVRTVRSLYAPSRSVGESERVTGVSYSSTHRWRMVIGT
jgi:hypothetical protein